MSKQTIFTGAGVAIVTPMNPDGSVNYERYRELVEWQIQNGTDAIISCGTTGESSTLDHEEHIEVMRAAVEQAAGRVPVISGTGSNDTRYCIELSLEAQRLGADALLLVSPYYNKTSQRGLIAHYTAIADAVELPIILYNVPSRTGVDIKPETIARLAAISTSTPATMTRSYRCSPWGARALFPCCPTSSRSRPTTSAPNGSPAMWRAAGRCNWSCWSWQTRCSATSILSLSRKR